MVSTSTSFHSELREVDTSRLLSTKSSQNFQNLFFWSLAANLICREKIVKKILKRRTRDMAEMFLRTCAEE